jgi:ABC-2 type transport system ATP-binding protein
MGDVKELCERVVIIDKGKIVFDGKLEEITKKFVDHKLISIVLSREIDPKKIEEIAEIKEFDYPRIKILVKRKKTSVVAAKILDKLPIADLDIEELPIEDIIRELFTGKNYA